MYSLDCLHLFGTTHKKKYTVSFFVLHTHFIYFIYLSLHYNIYTYINLIHTKRRYYKKGRYSSNISEISNTTISATPGKWSGTSTLTTNPIQSSATVSQTYTVKNFEVNFQMEYGSGANNIENIVCYIMYVPQGMNVSQDYNIQHPEYIMNYKFIGSPQIDGQPNYQPLRVKTRMARKLQTGDSIVLFITGYNGSDSTVSYTHLTLPTKRIV